MRVFSCIHVRSLNFAGYCVKYHSSLLRQFGLTHEMIEDLPMHALDDISNGRPSPVLPVSMEVNEGYSIKSRTRFANGDGEQWRKDGKREWDKYTFGIYGCWVMDDDGNLDYVPEEEYTEELWNEQKKAVGRHASTVAKSNVKHQT